METAVLRLGMADTDDIGAEERLRQNVLELLAFWRMKQTDLAARLGRSQSWVSKRLTGKVTGKTGSRFQLSDLDALAAVFGLSPSELLGHRYGKWDRRSGLERRQRADRRQARTQHPFTQREHQDRTDRHAAAHSGPTAPLPVTERYQRSANMGRASDGDGNTHY